MGAAKLLALAQSSIQNLYSANMGSLARKANWWAAFCCTDFSPPLPPEPWVTEF
ncbi:MAG: hypothetical protein WCS37_10855 [Chloroflexota bacterium]